MKLAFSASIIILLFAACQKDVAVKDPSVLEEITTVDPVSSDALLPLPCHSTSFLTNYPTVAGEQPPFRFTKTLYSDSRVKTINMLSRAVPKHPAYKNQVWETIGSFSYGPNMAKFVGTKQLWEYYKTPVGAGTRKSILKKPITLQFYFDERGHTFLVLNFSNPSHPLEAMRIVYGDQSLSPDAIYAIYIFEGSDEGVKTYFPNNDKYGNPLYVFTPGASYNSGLIYTYDYTIPRAGKNYSYTPSQNLISFEYNLCEVMQWIPQPTYQRKTVAGKFYPTPVASAAVTQSQVYKNHKFDAKGNLISFTYADNILQNTTWFCK